MVSMPFHVWCFYRTSNNASHSSQMIVNNRSVFRKVRHVLVLQPTARSRRLPHPQSLPTRQRHRKRQPGRSPRTRTVHTNGRALEVHVATGITRPPSDHLPLGIRLSSNLQRRRRAIRKGDALAKTQTLHPHESPPPVVSLPLSQLPSTLPPQQTPACLG